MRTLITAAIFIAVSVFAHFVNAQAIHGRLDRANLLVYRDGDGKTRPIHSTADWQKRNDMVLAGMQEVMGPLPGRDKRCAFGGDPTPSLRCYEGHWCG